MTEHQTSATPKTRAETVQRAAPSPARGPTASQSAPGYAALPQRSAHIRPEAYSAWLGHLEGAAARQRGLMQQLQQAYGNRYTGAVFQRQAQGCPPNEGAGALPRDGGLPLESGLRGSLEARFGQDFSGVRVHTDGEAARAAQRVQAHAFTVGREIYFGAGRFQPYTSQGQRLLAHELSHVVQQGGQAGPGVFASPPESGGLLEQQADAAAEQVTRGEPLALGLLSPVTPGMLQCQAGGQTCVSCHPSFSPPAQRPFSFGAYSGGTWTGLERNVAIGQGIRYEKWSPDIERQYRRYGMYEAAEALRRCRTEGRSYCNWVLTQDEVYELYTDAKKLAEAQAAAQGGAQAPAQAAPPPTQPTPSSREGAAFGAAGLAGVPLIGGMLMSPTPAPPPPSPFLPPPTAAPPVQPWSWAPPPPVAGAGGAAGAAGATTTAGTATTVTTGTAGGLETGVAVGSRAAVAVPIVAIGAILVISTIQLVQYGLFEQALRDAGFVILPSARSICMRGCHPSSYDITNFPSRPTPWEFPEPPLELGPRGRLIPGEETFPWEFPWPEPETPRRRRRQGCSILPMPQLGGNQEHNNLAARVTGAPIEYLVTTPQGLSYRFDGMDLLDTLYEVKTRYDFLRVLGLPQTRLSIRGAARVAAGVGALRWNTNLELIVAEACGHDFRMATNDPEVAELMRELLGDLIAPDKIEYVRFP